VLLYVRFPLSFRAVEEMMLLRGVQVSYETIRRWCRTFGQQFANERRRCRPRTGDKWHLDEVFLKINGETYYLWRAVNQGGGRWTKRETCSTCWCRAGATRRPPSA